MKEEQGTNLVSLGRALKMGYPIILRLPEDVPLLTAAFNGKDLSGAPLTTIESCTKGQNKRKSWAILEAESWPEFERTLATVLGTKSYPADKLYVGFDRYFRAFSELTISANNFDRQKEQKERLTRGLQEQGPGGAVGRGLALHADGQEVTAFPHFFNANARVRGRGSRLRMVIPHLNRRSGQLDFLDEGKSVDQNRLDL